uniref:ATP-dependent Clp protease proteolytic subunit n=1 Tax=Acacia hemiteles TaxID=1120453 RepID=A0A1D0CDX7_9FABA|nr:clpP1 [Acacia hemiteles]CUR03010.1 clpP1 [Acacia hemiteles]
MPVGVPKVPFRGPGDEEPSWVDLYNRLYRQRAIFLGQKIDSTIANQIMSVMLYLNIEDRRKSIEFFINSTGGSITSGMGIYDMMQAVEPDVKTICMGVAGSMACFLLQGGEMTQRIAFPHARVMMHQPLANIDDTGKAGDSLLDMHEVFAMYYNIVNSYIQRTGQPSWTILADLQRDNFMSAEEAQDHGIVDFLIDEYINQYQ